MGKDLFSEPETATPIKSQDGMIVILGNVPAKSNCYHIIILKNKDKSKEHASLAKGKELKIYERNFFYQHNVHRAAKITTEFELTIDVYFKQNRSDLDNSLKVVLDCLQECEAIHNDNLCVGIKARKFVDKERPRIEFKLKENGQITPVN